MKHLIKLYNTWEKAKEVFLKPSLRVYFGKWINDPNLPCWRKGPVIYVCRHKWLFKNCHLINNTVLIHYDTVEENYNGKPQSIKCYKHTAPHKLPGNLKPGSYAWNRNIRKKLKRWHLSWLPPMFYLPMWMQFKIFNWDVMWKTKFDEIRYEFPPQFTIVAFGLSLSFTLHSPVDNNYVWDDHYWEAILHYVHSNKTPTIRELLDSCGIYGRMAEGEERTYHFALRPEILQPRQLPSYYAAAHDVRNKENKVIL